MKGTFIIQDKHNGLYLEKYSASGALFNSRRQKARKFASRDDASDWMVQQFMNRQFYNVLRYEDAEE